MKDKRNDYKLVFNITHHTNLSNLKDSHCEKSVQIRSYFWSVFSCILTEYGEIRRDISPYSVREREYRSRNNSVFGHFLRSDFVISTPVFYTRPGTPRGIYHKFLIIGFQRAKILKDILLRANVSQVQKNEVFCGPCKKSRCENCEHIVSTNSFKSTATQ